MYLFRFLFLFSVAFALLIPDLSGQSGEGPPLQAKVRILFFTPSDVEPPAIVKTRMKEIVEYTRALYREGMKQWGYPAEQDFPVEMDSDGFPVVHFVKGEHTKASGKYDRLGFQQEVIGAAVKKYALPQRSQIWWIFLYEAVEKGWGRGGGNSIRGGTSTAYFYPNEGKIRPGDPLAADLLYEIKLKGCIHELGHAFGLPHIGPRNRDDMGNSLMGPINNAYFRRFGDKDKRVYLSEAAAAMLWKHPFFTGTSKDRARMPMLKFERFKAEKTAGNGPIEVTGKVVSNYLGHSVVIINETPRKSDYLCQAFVGKLEKDGTFVVKIDEFEQSGGTLRAVVCFNNGVVIGKTGQFGVRNGFAYPYRFAGGKFEFGPAKP